nr:2OG-Fe(II) oxygenase [Kineosporia babensis]
MLLYEEGQFFLPHQDSEKDDAMVATLVVTLPTEHTGGELVLHHLGEETVYRGLRDRISLVGFYADCRHEVRPVQSGYRVTLTYNLMLQGNPGLRQAEAQVIDGLAAAITAHFDEPLRPTTSSRPEHLAFLLDHEYSEHGLTWQKLKGSDAAAVAALRQAAEKAECDIVLGLSEIKETWDAWEDDGYYGETEGDEYQVNDLIEAEIGISWWRDAQGREVTGAGLYLSDSEVCAITPNSSMEPESSEYEGYMGNYGNTLDRWYRRAAVVMWPAARRFAIRAQADPAWALEELHSIARHSDPVAAAQQARELEPFWAGAVRTSAKQRQLLGDAIELSVVLGDAEVARLLLEPFRIERVRGEHAAALGRLVKEFGSAWFQDLVEDWFGSDDYTFYLGEDRRENWLTELPELCSALLGSTEARRECRLIARHLVVRSWTSLARLIERAAAHQSLRIRREALTGLGDPLSALLRAALAVGDKRVPKHVVEHCLKYEDLVADCVLQALRNAVEVDAGSDWEPPFLALGRAVAGHLQARVDAPIRAKTDWSIELPSGCACPLCVELKSFLADASDKRREWPLAKRDRQHLHGRIDGAELPVTHVTVRSGRPYTLVLAKTDQLFTLDEQRRQRDQADLEWLRTQGMA